MCCNRQALTRFAVIVAFALLAAARSAEAAQCTISTTPVVFGTYNVFNTAPSDSTGTVVYRCNGGGKNIWITVSRGASPSYFLRAMLNGVDFLGYNLFRDPSRTSIWGDGSSGTGAYFEANPPNNHDTVVTVYGRIPAGQDVRAGAYSDSVSIEINF
jgi:spore coat protein U-like protein